MSVLTASDVISFRTRRNFSRKQLASESGLTEGKIWRIENKGWMTEAEEMALSMCGVTSVTIPTTESPLPSAPVIELDEVAEPTQADAPTVVEASVGPDRIPIPGPDLAALYEVAQPEKQYERRISNSELQTFKRCRRKWWLAWYRGLRPRREAPVGVRQVGNRLHRALKEHYIPGGPKNPRALLDNLELLIISDRSIMQAQGWDEDTAKQFEKEADLERIMMEGYLQWLEETGADAELDVIGSEQYVEAGLDEFGDNLVALIGKLDVRVRRTSDGAIMFLDHKSVGSFAGPTALLPIGEQMIHYQLLEMLTAGEGQLVVGALYNMMKRVKRTAKANPPFFQRIEVRHNPTVLGNYRRRVISEIMDIQDVEDSLRNGESFVAYPSPTGTCTWDCDFFKVCSMFDDGSRVEEALSEFYVQGDPLSYYLEEVLGEEPE